MRLQKVPILILVVVLFFECKKRDSDITDLQAYNDSLKNQLEQILVMDQGIREILSGNASGDREKELLREMNLDSSDIVGSKKFDLVQEIDSVNLVAIEKIIEQYGYPGKSLVGEPANQAVFYVIQHSPLEILEKYFPIMVDAQKKGDISGVSLAMMEDRILMYKGQEQIYGTQIKGMENKDGEWIYFLWPLEDQDSVEIKRKQVGFEENLEEYLKKMGLEYQLYTLEDVSNF